MPTLLQLEQLSLGEPVPGETPLVRRCRELTTKQIADLTIEDLRLLLGQQLGVRTLLPVAVDVLVRDPWAEGDLYPGDLLSVVLRLPRSAWTGCAAARDALAERLRDLPVEDVRLRQAVAGFLTPDA